MAPLTPFGKLSYTWLPLKAGYVAVRSWRRECKQKEIKIIYKALIFNVQQIYVLRACAATCKVAEERQLNRGNITKIFITELQTHDSLPN